jgi:hypothetical protein
MGKGGEETEPDLWEEAEGLVGKDVRLHGLKSKPELNGTVAQVKSLVEDTGRYLVVLADGAEVALKVANFSLVLPKEEEPAEEETPTFLGKEVSVRGLKSKPELNGKLATVKSFVETSGRFVVVLADGSELALKPANFTVASAEDRTKARELETQEQEDEKFFAQLERETKLSKFNKAKEMEDKILAKQQSDRDHDYFKNVHGAKSKDVHQDFQRLGFGASMRIKP